MPGHDDRRAVRMGGQGGGDRAEYPTHETAAAAGADDGDIGTGAEGDEDTGGIAGRGAEALRALVIAEQFDRLGEGPLRCPLGDLGLILGRHGGHVRIDGDRFRIRRDDGQRDIASGRFRSAVANGQGRQLGTVEADEDSQ